LPPGRPTGTADSRRGGGGGTATAGWPRGTGGSRAGGSVGGGGGHPSDPWSPKRRRRPSKTRENDNSVSVRADQNDFRVEAALRKYPKYLNTLPFITNEILARGGAAFEVEAAGPSQEQASLGTRRGRCGHVVPLPPARTPDNSPGGDNSAEGNFRSHGPSLANDDASQEGNLRVGEGGFRVGDGFSAVGRCGPAAGATAGARDEGPKSAVRGRVPEGEPAGGPTR